MHTRARTTTNASPPPRLRRSYSPPVLRLQVFEGVPAPYDKMKRMVVPAALRLTHLKPGRDFAHLGRLCHEVSARATHAAVGGDRDIRSRPQGPALTAPLLSNAPLSSPPSPQVGWKHYDLIQRLETARKAASEAAHKKKAEAVRRVAAAKKALSA